MILLSGLEIFFIVIAVIAVIVIIFVFGLRKFNNWLGTKIVGKSPFVTNVATLNMMFNFKKVEDIQFEQHYATLDDARNEDGVSDEFASYLVLNETTVKDAISQCEYNKREYERYTIEYQKLADQMTTKNDKHGINLPYFLINMFEKLYYQVSHLNRTSESFSLVLNRIYHNPETDEDETFVSTLPYEKIKETLNIK